MHQKENASSAPSLVVEKFQKFGFHPFEDLGPLVRQVVLFSWILGKIEQSISGNLLPSLASKQFVHLKVVGLH